MIWSVDQDDTSYTALKGLSRYQRQQSFICGCDILHDHGLRARMSNGPAVVSIDDAHDQLQFIGDMPLERSSNIMLPTNLRIVLGVEEAGRHVMHSVASVK